MTLGIGAQRTLVVPPWSLWLADMEEEMVVRVVVVVLVVVVVTMGSIDSAWAGRGPHPPNGLID